jgi:hypothetical protein
MDQYKIMLALPGGPFCAGAVRGALTASANHQVGVDFNGNGWDDFDHLWARALQRSEDGQITHFAMLHSDIGPQAGWLDVLLDECDDLHADFLSAVVPLKDERGLTSCGVGIPGNPWGSFRRATMHELAALPRSFTAADMGYPGFPTLCNSGCWIADLRKPVFHAMQGDQLALSFDFPRRLVRQKDQVLVQRESEDWYFSRKLHELGARYYNTRRVALAHYDGNTAYATTRPWGTWQHDEATRPLWELAPLSHLDIEGWFDFADLYREQVQAVKVPPAHFVEVGSWLGKSAAYMAQSIKTSGKRIRFDAVDNWRGGQDNEHNADSGPVAATCAAVARRGIDLLDTWQRNLRACGVDEYVRPVRGDSEATAAQYADGALDFVFIDADHSPGRVYRDLAAWLPKLRAGGLLAGHDFDEAGPKEGATEFARDRNLSLQTRDRCFAFSKT